MIIETYKIVDKTSPAMQIKTAFGKRFLFSYLSLHHHFKNKPAVTIPGSKQIDAAIYKPEIVPVNDKTTSDTF